MKFTWRDNYPFRALIAGCVMFVAMILPWLDMTSDWEDINNVDALTNDEISSIQELLDLTPGQSTVPSGPIPDVSGLEAIGVVGLLLAVLTIGSAYFAAKNPSHELAIGVIASSGIFLVMWVSFVPKITDLHRIGVELNSDWGMLFGFIGGAAGLACGVGLLRESPGWRYLSKTVER